MKTLLVIPISFMLVACSMATTKKYDEQLNYWLNKNELSLVSTLGAPDSVYHVGDKKFLSYYSQYNQYIPHSTYRYQPFFAGSWIYYDPIENTGYQVVTHLCKTTFTIEKEKIIAWSHQGDGCIAK